MRHITYGEANKRLVDYKNKFLARVTEVVAQDRAELQAAQAEASRQQSQQQADEAAREDAQQAQADRDQAMRYQRAAALLGMLRANQPPPLAMPYIPPRRTFNCTSTTTGSMTNTNCD